MFVGSDSGQKVVNVLKPNIQLVNAECNQSIKTVKSICIKQNVSFKSGSIFDARDKAVDAELESKLIQQEKQRKIREFDLVIQQRAERHRRELKQKALEQEKLKEEKLNQLKENRKTQSTPTKTSKQNAEKGRQINFENQGEHVQDKENHVNYMNINDEQQNALECIAEVNSEMQSTMKNNSGVKNAKATLILPVMQSEEEEENDDDNLYEPVTVEYETFEQSQKNLRFIRERLGQISLKR